MLKSCCGKVVCSGCIHAVVKRDGFASLCPFCRCLEPSSDEEILKRMQKRMDAEAFNSLGLYHNDGMYGLPKDVNKALELFHRAADLGNATSYYNIGNGYFFGRGVDIDKKRAKHYYELGAMRGCVLARHNLAVIEENSGDMNRAIKHYMISVGSGFNMSLDVMQNLYSKGNATKDEYTKALRAYQKYLDEVKSDQRDEAAAAREIYKYIDYYE